MSDRLTAVPAYVSCLRRIRRRRGKRLAATLLAFASLALGGCMQMLWTAAVGPGLIAARLSERRSNVTFRVVDAADDRPVANATVRLNYPGG